MKNTSFVAPVRPVRDGAFHVGVPGTACTVMGTGTVDAFQYSDGKPDNNPYILLFIKRRQ